MPHSHGVGAPPSLREILDPSLGSLIVQHHNIFNSHTMQTDKLQILFYILDQRRGPHNRMTNRSILERRHSLDNMTNSVGSPGNNGNNSATITSIVTRPSTHNNPRITVRRSLSLNDGDNPPITDNPTRQVISTTRDRRDVNMSSSELWDSSISTRGRLSSGSHSAHDPSLPSYCNVVDTGPPPAYDTLGF